jgi:CRISPR/Cas system-associated exonuclease Cas4 (RecB family)
MSQKGVKCVRGYIPHADCRACALKPLHPCMLSADMLEAMREPENPTDDPGDFTPSRLLGCDRRAGLELGGDTWLDIEADWPLTRGNMVHALMEKAPDVPNIMPPIREMRLSTMVHTKYGVNRFTGKPDLISVLRKEEDEESGVTTFYAQIVDYKSTGKIEHGDTAPKRNHIMQVNIYAWLVRRELPKVLQKTARIVVEELEIIYVDMQKTRRFTSAGTLEAKGKRLNRTPPYEYETLTLEAVPMLSDEVVERWVVKHIESRIQATEEKLPPPLTGEAAWLCRFCPVYTLCHSLPDAQEVA